MTRVPVTNPNRIRALREAKGLGIAHVAVAFNVHPDTVERWERVGPPARVIPRLAAYLDADPSHLMGWDEAAA